MFAKFEFYQLQISDEKLSQHDFVKLKEEFKKKKRVIGDTESNTLEPDLNSKIGDKVLTIHFHLQKTFNFTRVFLQLINEEILHDY